jgi:hypothetical protein
MRHARYEVLSWAIAFLLVMTAACGGPLADKPADIEAAIRNAQNDSSNALVVMDVAGKYHVFPVTGLAEVSGNRITVKKGSFAFFNGEGEESPMKVAKELSSKWKEPQPTRGDFSATVDSNAKLVVSFHYQTLDKDMTVEVKQLLMVTKKD